MNKTDLINVVAEQADLTRKKEAGSAVDAVFESIQNSLAKGEKVQLIRFGSSLRYVNVLHVKVVTLKLVKKLISQQVKFQHSKLVKHLKDAVK